MVWNCSIIAVALLFIVFRKNKAFGNESKTIGEKAERSNVYNIRKSNAIFYNFLTIRVYNKCKIDFIGENKHEE